MTRRTAAKRAAVDKTIVEAASQIPVERLGSAGIGEGIGHATSLLMRLGETINRHYGSKEHLSETEIQTYTKLATRTADAMGNLAAAAGEAPLEFDRRDEPMVIEGEELLALDFSVFKKVEGTS
jgi:hypothetical protein